MAMATDNPQQKPSPPQRSQTVNAATPQQPPDPFQAMGGGYWTGQQWVPRDHPMAQQPPAAAQPGPNGPPQPQAPTPPAPVGPQQPVPGTPAPQIPLGSTTAPQPQGSVTTNPDGTTRVTSTGLRDANQPQGDPLQAAVRESLLALMGQNINSASVTDPDLAPESRTFAAAVERQAAQRRAERAEQAAADGSLSSGAFEGAMDNLSSEVGQAIGANDAALVGKKLETRRQQLQQALQVASSMGMAQEANDLQRQIANLDAQIKTRGQDIDVAGMQMQRELANLDAGTKTYLADLDASLRREGYGLQERLGMLDAELRRLGINTQGNLGQLELALRRELGIGQLNLGLLEAMLRDRQVGNGQGIDLATLQAQLNRDSLLARMP